jgi:hypothetical protein
MHSMESSQHITENGMIYSPDVLVFGFFAWIAFNVLYFIFATIERKWGNTDRLSRTNTVVLAQFIFISMSLMFLNGERLKTRAVETFIECGGILAIVNAVLRFIEKIKITKGDFTIEVIKDNINTKKTEDGKS